MFDDATRRAIAAHAARLNIEVAALLAVCEIESARQRASLSLLQLLAPLSVERYQECYPAARLGLL